jgi:hypothetical protein
MNPLNHAPHPSNALRAVGCTLGCTILDQALAHKARFHGDLKDGLASAPSL